MKILILTAPRFDDYEMIYPYFRLQEAGVQVEIASVEKGPVQGIHYSFEAEKTYNDVIPSDYDGLLLPGGSAPETVRLYPKAVEIVSAFVEACKPVAAICHGQQILITADLLKGVKCTCYKSIKDDVINAGGLYEEAPVVVDKNIITSRWPMDLPYFLSAFLKNLGISS